MTNTALVNLIEEINDYEGLLEEVKEIIAEKEEIIKEFMSEGNQTELNVDGKYFVRWTPYTRSNFNISQFKKDYEMLWKSYLKYTDTKKFSITAA